MTVPMVMVTKETATPTVSETRDAKMRRLIMSRPTSSVPSQCCGLGPAEDIVADRVGVERGHQGSQDGGADQQPQQPPGPPGPAGCDGSAARRRPLPVDRASRARRTDPGQRSIGGDSCSSTDTSNDTKAH